MVVSDILGDPIHLIGGGPTVAEPAADPILRVGVNQKVDVNGVLPATIYKVMEQTIARSQHRANANDLSRNRVFVLAITQPQLMRLELRRCDWVTHI